ncbi:hypothetical protein TNCT_346821 [Trichonephila clavata]|uniref:Uncharacterized protein n=1 Tax=Trichonephila clavata TaxID=2740835 RepID=A0A8X6G5F7_TRICU|nr:hypothetical protein TNCT_346821 [Trichonephila clavata]
MKTPILKTLNPSSCLFLKYDTSSGFSRFLNDSPDYPGKSRGKRSTLCVLSFVSYDARRRSIIQEDNAFFFSLSGLFSKHSPNSPEGRREIFGKRTLKENALSACLRSSEGTDLRKGTAAFPGCILRERGVQK